jgi:hypothetical protein
MRWSTLPDGLTLADRLAVRWMLARGDLLGLRERFVLAIVWRLPRWLAYWSAIRVMAHATTGAYSSTIVTELLAIDALKRWDPPTCQDPTHAH